MLFQASCHVRQYKTKMPLSESECLFSAIQPSEIATEQAGNSGALGMIILNTKCL